MTDADGPRFEDTMASLESHREAVELRFRELLTELTGRIDAVRAAADRSARLYESQVEVRREALAAVRDGLTEEDREQDADLSWPTSGRGVRAAMNRFARRILRDFLEVMDRREDFRTRRVDDLKERVDRLQATVSTEGESAAALNESLTQAHEALQATLSIHAQMLDLVNAKDAEVLQRAVAGPLRRMEVLFHEFSRQQEALLSQLVGRRQELDRLVASITPGRPEEL